MRWRQQQFTFTGGELDPLLVARSDLARYFSGAQEMTNVKMLPQGGFTRDDGLKYIDTVLPTVERVTGQTITLPNSASSTSNANDNDLTTKVVTSVGSPISTNDNYVIVHYDLGSAQEIIFADAVHFYLNSLADIQEFFIQYSTDDTNWTTLGEYIPTTSLTTIRRRTGPITARYWRLVRIGTTDCGSAQIYVAEFNLWKKTTTLSNSRLIYFNFTTDQRYAILATDQNMRVYKSGVFQTDVRSPFTTSQLSVIDWAHQDDAIIFVHEDVTPQLLERLGSDTQWGMDDITFDTIPAYRFDATSSQPNTTVTPGATTGSTTLTLTAGSGLYTWQSTDVGQYVDGNGGYARIVSLQSSTVANIIVEIPFYNTEDIATGDWTLLAGWEDAWSSSRGYPRSVTFYEGRLWFAGHKSLLSLIWASRTDLPFDFDLGQNLDDDAIVAQIRADEVPEIFSIYPGRNLQIFTSTDERWVPQQQGQPLTPSNFETRSSGTKHGITQGLRPFESGGVTMFVQAQGKALRAFLYEFTEDAYKASNLSWESSHMISSPVDCVLRRATSTSEADLMILVNDDGTLAILTAMRDQDVGGWVRRNTESGDSSFLNIGIEGSDVYAVVERTIDGSAARYLEKFDVDHLLDCSISGTGSGSTITGLDVLEGKTVKVICDGFVQADQTVSGGSITPETAYTESYEVGLDLTPVVKPMPIAQQLQDGTILGEKKRISALTFRLSDTINLVVNSQQIPFRSFGSGVLDQPIDPFTGIKRVDGLLGWTDDGDITITQNAPAAMTVVAMEARVEI